MSATCPECGKPLGPNAIQGLCPECMMRIGLGSGTQAGPAADGGAAPGKPKPFVPPAPAELATLFPQLEILALIGQGGMGAVYRARQKELDRIVALKILPPGIGQDPAFAERFAREAKALAKLNHPGIVTLYEFGHVGGAKPAPESRAGVAPAPLYYFLMEYVDGVNLRQLLHTGRIAPREALAIVPQICDALQYAHDQSIVHRDIKPENILLDRRGRVKVADFGVAKLVAADPASAQAGTSAPRACSALTEAGKVVGTPQYMAPEQLEHPDAVDHRADIYALGIVFYQMLTGEMPGKPIEPPSHKVLIDVRLDEVVLRALEKDPTRRYSQASVLKTQVETIATALPANTAAPPPTTPHRSAAESEVETVRLKAGASRRFSRTAIAGAAWALLFFTAATLVGLFGAPYSGGHDLPTELLLALARFLLGLALSAVVGTTILGGVAIIQIRRSAGQLCGLWLAVFDGLCFPLMALDMFKVVPILMGRPGLWGGPAPPLVVLVALAVDALIMVAVWRLARPRSSSSPAATAPRPVSRGFLGFAYGTMAAGILIVTALTLLYCGRLVDNINLPFVDDPKAVGLWTTVDLVDEPDQFQPGSQRWAGPLYFKQLILLPGGGTPDGWKTWTKGFIMHKGVRSASRYEIREMDGTRYMFMEWKSGDYSYARLKPPHYVLRWLGTVVVEGGGQVSAPAKQ